MLRVAGEVDLLTIATLQGALTSSLARGTCHLLVDLAEMTFCCVRGLSLLVQAGRTAAGHGTGYSVTAASRQADRVWTVLWPVDERPIQHLTAATGVAAAITELGAPANRPDAASSGRDRGFPLVQPCRRSSGSGPAL